MQKLEKKIKLPYLESHLLNINQVPIARGGFGNIFKGSYLSFSIAKKEMMKFKEKDFLKEVAMTYCYRNSRSPTLMGVSEDTHDTSNKIKSMSNSLIIEFIKGCTLRDKLTELKRETWKDQLLSMIMIINIAKAIEFIHYKGLIHRDIKPENIMITESFDVKLIDFGISKECNKTSDFTTSEKGSIFYEPPENTVTDIYNDEISDNKNLYKTDFNTQRKISRAYDIWSLGLIIGEIITGETPWGDELKRKPNQILINLINKVPYPISSKIKNPNLRLLISYCTEIYPKYRIEIREAIHILNKIFVDMLKKHYSHDDDNPSCSYDQSNIYCNIKEILSTNKKEGNLWSINI